MVVSERPEYDVWKGGALLALALFEHEWYYKATYEKHGSVPEPLLCKNIPYHRFLKTQRFLCPARGVHGVNDYMYQQHYHTLYNGRNVYFVADGDGSWWER